MFMSVDLPEPDAPMMAIISPASMSRFDIVEHGDGFTARGDTGG